MNRRTSLLVSLPLFAFAVGWMPCAGVAKAAKQPATAPLEMCLGQPVPAGHVMVKIGRTPKCGGGIAHNTMWVMKYAGLPKFTACGPINIPGYVVVSAGRTPQCKGIGVSAGGGTVTIPTYDTVTMIAYEGLKTFSACAPLRNIPQGYVVTRHSVTPGCKPYVGSVLTPWNTLTLSKYEGLATFTACMPLNPIPPGYVVVAQKRIPQCGSGPATNAVTLKRR
jgi:hypothetical protein